MNHPGFLGKSGFNGLIAIGAVGMVAKPGRRILFITFSTVASTTTSRITKISRMGAPYMKAIPLAPMAQRPAAACPQPGNSTPLAAITT